MTGSLTSPCPRPSATSAPPPVIATAASVEIHFEHALGGSAGDPVELLAVVVLDSRLRIGPVKVVLSSGTRVTINWSNPLSGSDVAGGARKVRLSPRVQQQVAEALVRQLLSADFGNQRP